MYSILRVDSTITTNSQSGLVLVADLRLGVLRAETYKQKIQETFAR